MIIQKENKILRAIAKEVPLGAIGDAKMKKLLKEMADVLAVAKNGVALAAPQIGISSRIFIIDGFIWKHGNRQPLSVKTTDEAELPIGSSASEKQEHPPAVFINPVIKKISQKKQIVSEGCLSVEDVYGVIKRAEKVTVEALNENGAKFTRGCSGLLAQIVQHEMDHLNGILFIDTATKLQKIDSGK